MSLIADLLNKHASKLDAGQRAAAEEYVRRFDAQTAFANPEGVDPVDAQTGFIMFEREFSPTPVILFGQDVPALAHTRLRIFRSKPVDGGWEPAEEIFSARISEKSLTESVLMSNRGEGQPLTVTRLGDLELPAHPKAPTKPERATANRREKQNGDFVSASTKIEAMIEDHLNRPNAELREHVSDLGLAIRNMTSTSYDLELHVEAMSTMRTELLTEAAHAALHAHKVAEALAQPRVALPAPAPMDWDAMAAEHPLLDVLLDSLSDDLREASRILISSEIREMSGDMPRLSSWLSDDPSSTEVTFPKDNERFLSIPTHLDRAETNSHIKSMAYFWNWANNPHLQKSRDLRRPTQASISFTQTQGWTGDIHSSLPTLHGGIYQIAINAAWEHHEIGNTRVRSGTDKLIQIEMIAEDLMTALRGHPEGLPIPCSFRGMAGAYMPPAKRPAHKVDTDIARMSKEVSELPEVIHLFKAFEELDTLSRAKRSGKAWREEFLAALGEATSAYEQAEASIRAAISDAQSVLDDHVVQSTNAILGSISRSLPGEVLNLLRIKSE